jgi:hypothetical protein
MTSKLRCSNQDCVPDLKRGDLALACFEVTLTVGADREPAEDLREIEPGYFRCIDCGFEAVEG